MLRGVAPCHALVQRLAEELAGCPYAAALPGGPR